MTATANTADATTAAPSTETSAAASAVAPAIIIGCDHAALDLKNIIVDYLRSIGIEVNDVGTHTLDSVDYPDIANQVAGAVSDGAYERGILLCGTGLGMSMAANKHPHVRAALCNDLFSAQLGRLHNDANILAMGGRVIGDVLAIEIVKTWLNTPYEGGRHQRRLNKFAPPRGAE
jgi:ribose 5-phosphate isomerase B